MPRKKDPNSLNGKLRTATEALQVGQCVIFTRPDLTTMGTTRSSLFLLWDQERNFSVEKLPGKDVKITRNR